MLLSLSLSCSWPLLWPFQLGFLLPPDIHVALHNLGTEFGLLPSKPQFLRLDFRRSIEAWSFFGDWRLPTHVWVLETTSDFYDDAKDGVRGPPGLDSVSDELQYAPELLVTQAQNRADSSVIEKLSDDDIIGGLSFSEISRLSRVFLTFFLSSSSLHSSRMLGRKCFICEVLSDINGKPVESTIWCNLTISKKT